MKKRLFAILLLLLTFAVSVPRVALADAEDAPKVDARLEGYATGSGALKDAGGTALTWLLFIVLGAICIGVMFINSKRSHLD